MMATKVDQTSSVEPGRVQSTGSMSTSSIVSAGSPKVSMFGAKSGFVIPKNKLSGSLVPIFRGGGKVEGVTTVKDEGIKQVQRKTKWGVDLTQDAAVRKGRALAYQTRVEQITQQLSSGALESGDDQGPQSPNQALNHDSAKDHTDDERPPPKMQSQNVEALELERREIIGEILHLNPSYKTPLDYKPLLKEAKVPVPNKAYPGYNFIGLLLGPESNTQKRLEEETGAKVRVLGTKMDTGEKREVTLSGISDAHGAEELYVHVSADTYEKVDAAVALIELLLTPVSGSSAVASTTSSSVDPSKVSASVFVTTTMTTVSQGVLQPAFMPAQLGTPQFHPYLAPWFQTAPSSAPSHPPSGFMPIHRFPPSPVAPQYFGQSPFGSLPRTLSPPANRPQFLMQVMQQPPNQAIPPQNRPIPGQPQPPMYPVMRPNPNSAQPAQFTSQPMPAGSMPISRPPSAFNPQQSPRGNSPGWPTAPPNATQPLRPNNITQMTPPSVNTPSRPPQMFSQTTIVSRPQPNFPNNMIGRPPAANFAPPTSFPLRPSPAPPAFSSVPPLVRPVSAPLMAPSSSGPPLTAPMPASTQVPHPPAALQRPTLPSASAPFIAQTSMPPHSIAPVTARPPVPLTQTVPGIAPPTVQSPQPQSPILVSSSGTMPSFSPVTSTQISPVAPIRSPAITAPKPVRPSSGDFTFQPLRAQVPASPTTPGPNSPSVQNMSQVPLVAPQAPSFRPAMQNSAPAPPMVKQGWPMTVNQTVPSQTPVPPPRSTAPFSVNPTTIQLPPRLPFPSQRPVQPMAPTNQMGLPSFSPAPRGPNLSAATQMGRPVFSPAPQPNLSSRPSNPLQPHQNHLSPANRPSGITPLNQQFRSNPPGLVASGPASSPGGNQIYDPFSPTSISPQPGGDPLKARKQETDAEYEDLMASVGVK